MPIATLIEQLKDTPPDDMRVGLAWPWGVGLCAYMKRLKTAFEGDAVAGYQYVNWVRTVKLAVVGCRLPQSDMSPS